MLSFKEDDAQDMSANFENIKSVCKVLFKIMQGLGTSVHFILKLLR